MFVYGTSDPWKIKRAIYPYQFETMYQVRLNNKNIRKKTERIAIRNKILYARHLKLTITISYYLSRAKYCN